MVYQNQCNLLSAAKLAAGGSMGRQSKTVVVDAEEAAVLESLAAEYGVEIHSTKAQGIDPVTAVVVVLIGSYLAVTTVVDHFEKRRGGQVIDLRPQAHTVVYRDPQVRHDLILILTADGGVKIHTVPLSADSGRIIEALTQSLVKIAQPNAQSAAAVARERLGDSVSIEASITAGDLRGGA
jgi:hypothetical protein